MLQCVLQYVAVCCSVLQRVAACYITFPCAELVPLIVMIEAETVQHVIGL